MARVTLNKIKFPIRTGTEQIFFSILNPVNIYFRHLYTDKHLAEFH